MLKKRGYTIVEMKETKMYDVVTIFNVLDVCNIPEDILDYAIKHTNKNGSIIMSLPFPIHTRSWDNTKIQQTNHLSQPKNTTFEEAVSDFYMNFLKKYQLKVTFFTRLPYMVSLPETQKTTIYDNGLFVCQKI